MTASEISVARFTASPALSGKRSRLFPEISGIGHLQPAATDTPDRPRSRAPVRRVADSRPKKSRFDREKNAALAGPALSTPPSATPPAPKSRTRTLFLRGRKTCIGTRLPFFSAPIRFAALPTALRASDGNTKAQRICAQPPRLRFCDSARPQSALPEAKDKKKTMPKHRLFLFNTPGTRRKHQSP